MAHYYAFCQVHKKCGPNRPATAQGEMMAWNDCNHHLQTVGAPHGQIYVKLSSYRVVNNKRIFSYKTIKQNNSGE